MFGNKKKFFNPYKQDSDSETGSEADPRLRSGSVPSDDPASDEKKKKSRVMSAIVLTLVLFALAALSAVSFYRDINILRSASKWMTESVKANIHPMEVTVAKTDIFLKIIEKRELEQTDLDGGRKETSYEYFFNTSLMPSDLIFTLKQLLKARTESLALLAPPPKTGMAAVDDNLVGFCRAEKEKRENEIKLLEKMIYALENNEINEESYIAIRAELSKIKDADADFVVKRVEIIDKIKAEIRERF